MIDLHSHLLPAVDDGSRTLEQSVAVLQRMAAGGVTEICLTPHLLASRVSEGPPPAHDEAFASLAAAAPPGIRLRRGAEVMLDRRLTPRAAAARRITLGGGRHLLVEFSRMVAPPAGTAALAAVLEAGLVPLLAHPERYPAVTAEAVRHWRSMGVLMQVDATTLFLPTNRGLRARELLALGLADVLAADNHGDDRSVVEPFRRIAGSGGEDVATLLMVANPAHVLADQRTEPVDGFEVKVSLISRVRSWFEGLQP